VAQCAVISVDSFSVLSPSVAFDTNRDATRSRHLKTRIFRREMVTSNPSSVELPETSPLDPNSFAGLVEKGIIDRFGDDASRIVESWRLVDRGYEHREFVGRQQEPPVSEEDADKSNCHQHCHSYVPGLPAKTFYDVNDFEWTKKLASRYSEIREEFLSVTADMDKLTEEGNNIWAGALSDDASSYGEGWRTLVLLDRGTWDPVNVNLFPKAATAVKECGVPAVEVFFASMKPHTDIKLHSDFTNFVLTSHLALEIPENGSNKCRLSVGDDTREWLNGEVMLFDTSIMHDAINESDGTRYILMLRLWHPSLTEPERNALQFIYDCLEVPELLSTLPEERLMGDVKLAALRAFPEIKRKASRGFSSSGNKKNKRKKKGSGGKGFA